MKNRLFARLTLTLLVSALLLTACNDKDNKPKDDITPNNDTTQTEDAGSDKNNTYTEVEYNIPLVKSINVTDETPGDYYGIYALSDGYFKAATQDFTVGIINSNGEVIMPCEYITLRDICDNVTAVRDDMGMWSYFNVESRKFLVEKQDSMFDFSEGIGCYFDGKEYKYINPDGTPAFEGKFFEAAAFSDGLSRVLTDDAFGYIDKSGKIVIH